MTAAVAAGWLELQLQAAAGKLGATEAERTHHRRQALAWARGPRRGGALSLVAIAAALDESTRSVRVAMLRAARGPRRKPPGVGEPPAELAPSLSVQARQLRTLAAAVLAQAIADLTGGGARLKYRLAIAEAARAWFASDEREHLYSFRGCCELLGINAGRMRHEAERVAREGLPAGWRLISRKDAPRERPATAHSSDTRTPASGSGERPTSPARSVAPPVAAVG